MVSNSPSKVPTPFDEDDDVEGCCNVGDYNCVSSFEVDLGADVLSKCKLLIVAEGIHASAFGKSCLLAGSQQAVGRIEKQIQIDPDEKELWGLRNRKPDPSPLYQLNETTLLCFCSPHLLPEDIYRFASTILSRFSADMSVITLTSSSAACYKSDVHLSDLNIPFARSLATPTFHGPIKVTKLEQPNIMDGISAGFLSGCDIKGLGAAACIVYTSSLDLELGVVEAFSSFLASLHVYGHININKKAGAVASVDARSKTGNLYV